MFRSNKFFQIVSGFIAFGFTILQGLDWLFNKYDVDGKWFNYIVVFLFLSFIISLIILFLKNKKLCDKYNIDYDKVIEYAIIDERLGKSHWSVPGPDGDFGFGGHCFPKDLNALIFLTEKYSTTNNVLKSVNKTNDAIRTNRDWEQMFGRAVNKKKNL